MTISESKGRFFYKTNRFESIRITNRTESIRIANWNALARTHTTGLGSSAHPRLKKLGWTSRGVDADPFPFHLPSLPSPVIAPTVFHPLSSPLFFPTPTS